MQSFGWIGSWSRTEFTFRIVIVFAFRTIHVPFRIQTGSSVHFVQFGTIFVREHFSIAWNLIEIRHSAEVLTDISYFVFFKIKIQNT